MRFVKYEQREAERYKSKAFSLLDFSFEWNSVLSAKEIGFERN
jgi:hypothetical protein